MNVEVQRQDGNLIALIEGSVDGNNAAAFQASLQDAVQEGDKSMVLDLGALVYISSAGLRVLLLVAKDMQNKGANFAICSLQGQVRELFTVSGFDQIIQISDSQEARHQLLQRVTPQTRFFPSHPGSRGRNPRLGSVSTLP